jgi:peptide/nickel transport system ATP-binding protein
MRPDVVEAAVPTLSLLEVRNLDVSFPTPDGLVRAVQGASFSLDAGQTLGIVGESGSGKSVACMTVMGLVRGGQVSGQVVFDGRDVLAMREEERRHLRGGDIGMVFQDPLSSLHPLYKVGWQIAEAIRAHERVSRKEAHARAVEQLALVGIPTPQRRADEYPYQYSGGMRQRAMIAMALALRPKLLIADEPTTALDVTVQAQIIELIKGLQSELAMAVIMVTHDLGVVAGMADNVAVMYAGKVVEYADRRRLYYSPAHPYTMGLLASLPTRSRGQARLAQIAGQPPSLISLPSGCSFHPRCPVALERCRSEEPAFASLEDGGDQGAACWLAARNGHRARPVPPENRADD